MNRFYTPIAARALHRCEHCHAPESMFNFPFEVEHIAPLSAGGQDEEANLALACRSCNLYKWAYLGGVDPLSQATVRLFNPRRDSWHRHFRFDRDSGLVTGMTPIGRATVDRLQMNSKAQVNARRQWTEIGTYL